MSLKFDEPKFTNTEKRLRELLEFNFEKELHAFGKEGVIALSKATPVDTGETSDSWSYKVTKSGDTYRLSWENSKMAGRTQTPLVILIQYGHGTRGGTFVPGIDFINPALKPVFERAKDKIMAEVLR